MFLGHYKVSAHNLILCTVLTFAVIFWIIATNKFLLFRQFEICSKALCHTKIITKQNQTHNPIRAVLAYLILGTTRFLPIDFLVLRSMQFVARLCALARINTKQNEERYQAKPKFYPKLDMQKQKNQPTGAI